MGLPAKLGNAPPHFQSLSPLLFARFWAMNCPELLLESPVPRLLVPCSEPLLPSFQAGGCSSACLPCSLFLFLFRGRESARLQRSARLFRVKGVRTCAEKSGESSGDDGRSIRGLRAKPSKISKESQRSVETMTIQTMKIPRVILQRDDDSNRRNSNGTSCEAW